MSWLSKLFSKLFAKWLPNESSSWQWFYRLGSPKWFYRRSGQWLPWLSLAALLVLATGLVWGLAFAPEDAKQGNSFRIIYIHVPAAFLAQSGYFIMAIAGAIGLIWKMKISYMVMKAHLGCLLGLGCTHYLNADSAVSLRRCYGPAIRLSQYRCGE
jgi:ABC-type transport system involved in cytochrome c biogenesis permease subunit